MSAYPINRAMPWEACDWKSALAISYLMFIFTLLILCGDVKCNPGPHCETIYPCGLRDQKVDCGVKGIACDSCNMWYHCSCISMQSTDYERLDSTSAEWKCFQCDVTFPDNSLYHSYSVEVSNSFSLLAGPMFNDSVFLMLRCVSSIVVSIT